MHSSSILESSCCRRRLPSPQSLPSMRILVIGSDVSAKVFSALMKHKRGDKVSIDMMSVSAPHIPPSPGLSLTSPWIRNDSRGRWIVLDLLRNILNSQQYVNVSKVGLKTAVLTHLNSREIVPSFSFMIRNLFAFSSEPFRRRFPSISSDVSSFLSFRFGEKFSQKYSPIIQSVLVGKNDDTVSAMAVMPRVFSESLNGYSILMSPLRRILNAQKSTKNGNVDVLDHDWQRLMSGGNFIQVDMQSLDRDLDGYLRYMGVEPLREIDPKDLRLRKEGKVVFANSKEYDLIVTSEDPTTIWNSIDSNGASGSPPEYMQSLSLVSKVSSTMISVNLPVGGGKEYEKIPICWGSKGGSIFGAIINSNVWDVPKSDSTSSISITVFSNTEPDHTEISSYLKTAFPKLSGPNQQLEFSIEKSSFELIPSHMSPSRLDDMLSFHTKFRLPIFGPSLEVLGKYYYATSGSVYDLVNDAKWLANRIDERYWNFPKFVENELRSDYVNRDSESGFSLDGSTRSSPSVSPR